MADTIDKLRTEFEKLKTRLVKLEFKKVGEEIVFNGLTLRPIEQFGVAFDKLVIPTGWDKITMEEGIHLLKNDGFVRWSKFKDGNHDFYCKHPFSNLRAAGFYYIDSVFRVYGDNGTNVNPACSRGVLLVKKCNKK